jgi:Na+/melibiose symporter-like transporter
MPGLIPHLVAGTALYFIGVFYYRSYFKENNKLLLAIACFSFSILPDLFLGLYYTTGLLSYETLLPYHVFTHLILTPIAIIVFAILLFRFDTKRKPIWVIGILALLVHIVMDLLIQETNLFI